VSGFEGFEDRVPYTLKAANNFTYYGVNTIFDETPIPGTFEYTITGNLLIVDSTFW
jgi:hypothetical protein